MDTGAKKTINKAPELNKLNTKQVNTENLTRGTYNITYLIFDPEAPKGRGVIRIQLPDRKQYVSVRRQIRRKKALVVFQNEYGEPQTVNIANPNMISCTVEKYELSKKSKVVMPGREATQFG